MSEPAQNKPEPPSLPSKPVDSAPPSPSGDQGVSSVGQRVLSAFVPCKVTPESEQWFIFDAD